MQIRISSPLLMNVDVKDGSSEAIATKMTHVLFCLGHMGDLLGYWQTHSKQPLPILICLTSPGVLPITGGHYLVITID